VATGHLAVARKSVARHQLAPDNPAAKLPRDLVAQRLRIVWSEMEEETWCITVHSHYIQYA
jgi:hypothetical protein